MDEHQGPRPAGFEREKEEDLFGESEAEYRRWQAMHARPVAPNESATPLATGIQDAGDPAHEVDDTKPASNDAVIKPIAASVAVVVLVLVGILLFFHMRQRRKKKRQILAAQAQYQERRRRSAPTVQAHMASLDVPSRQPPFAAVPSQAPPAGPTPPQPVLLGPILAAANSSYYTGIDTSDAVSLDNDHAGLQNPFADSSSLDEEAPPPYRPRSSITSWHGAS